MRSRAPRRDRWSPAPVVGIARHLLARFSRRVCWLLLRSLPSQRHAVVHGWPMLEGNVVELLPSLDDRYPHACYWLVDGDISVARRLVDLRHLRRVRVVPKRSARAVWLAMTAEVTFFTHGLFTAARPPGSRLVVNLWHGDGPKATTHVGGIHSTVAVTGARMWQEYKARLFGLRNSDVAWTGNPRSDALTRGMTDEQWNRLGLDPDSKLVLWMPTFRVGRSAGGLEWHDGRPLSGRADLQSLGDVIARTDVTLVVKPHPMDRDDYSRLGIRVITDADLQEAGVALYELLGCCAALISDSSSTWVDFLTLRRPVAFFLPDVDELQSGRSFNVPDILSILPGPLLREVDGLRGFLEAVSRDSADPDLLYDQRRSRIGPAPLGGASARLLDWLDAYQVARERRPLFGTRPGAPRDKC